MPPRPRLAAACLPALLWALALAACTADPPPSPPPAPAASGLARPLGCKLPAPVKSDDACSTDADCGVSEPCHAPACVARAKSHPARPDTMCTLDLQCRTADANRCGCHEGRCALIPPS